MYRQSLWFRAPRLVRQSRGSFLLSAFDRLERIVVGNASTPRAQVTQRLVEKAKQSADHPTPTAIFRFTYSHRGSVTRCDVFTLTEVKTRKFRQPR